MRTRGIIQWSLSSETVEYLSLNLIFCWNLSKINIEDEGVKIMGTSCLDCCISAWSFIGWFERIYSGGKSAEQRLNLKIQTVTQSS